MKISPIAAMASLFMATKSKPNKPVKNCLRCGKKHQHNNSFCSAECCKTWQAEKRAHIS